MIATQGGTNRVEVVLAFTTDPSQVTAGMGKVAAAAKNVDAAVRDAQKSMSQLKGPTFSGKMPTPYGVQGSTYGVAEPTANRIGYSNGTTPPKPPNFPSTVAGPGGQRFSFDAYTGAQKSIASEAKAKEQAEALKALKGPEKPFSGGLADVAVKGAIAIAAVGALTKGLQTLGDASKSAAAKVLGVAEAIPVVGGPAAGLSRGVIQFGERKLRKEIAASEINNSIYESQQQVRFDGQQKLTGARREQESVISGARGFFGGGVVVPVDGEDERVTQAKMDEARAKKAADAAAKDQASFSKELGQAATGVKVNENYVGAAKSHEDKVNKQREEEQNAGGAAGFLRRNEKYLDFAVSPMLPLIKAANGNYAKDSPLNGVEEGMETNRQRKDLGRALLTQEEAIRTEKDKSINAAMKLAEYEKARTETMKAQAAVLKDQLATAKAQEKSAGSMSDEEKKALLDAARNAKEKGLGNVSAEERSLVLISSLTSGYFGKEAEKLGAADPTLAAIRAITGEKTSGQLGNELKDIAAKIDVKIDIDENALAEKLGNILGQFVNKLEVLIGKQVANTNAQISTDGEKARKLQEANLS